jgi:hypothetical protein
MLFFSLWPDGGGHPSIADGISALRTERAARSEMGTVIDLGFTSSRHIPIDLGGRLSGLPLKIHARYQREEVLSALGWASMDRTPSTFQAGVVYAEDLGIDAFLINLKKSDTEFSPSTMYRDYPISRTLFHWESQSRTAVASRTGQRYVTGSSTVLLFVRAEKKNEFGTAPYLFLGPAKYVRHEGERPIAITWRLAVPMPMDFYHLATVAAQ